MPASPTLQRAALALIAVFGAIALFAMMQISSTGRQAAEMTPVTTQATLPSGQSETVAPIPADTSTAELAAAPSVAAGDVAPANEAEDAAAPATATEAQPAAAVPSSSMNVRVTHSLRVRARPGAGAVVGSLEPTSRYIHQDTYAWVMEQRGAYGKVVVPHSYPQVTGWVLLKGLQVIENPVIVKASISSHRITVYKHGRAIFSAKAGMGSSSTPTPAGQYFVTDRVTTGSAPNTGSFGHFAFGLSGKQPRLPSGWPPNHDQMALHGTGNLNSIGANMSTGCLRLTARTLDRLKPLLQLGTPVIIEP